MQKRSYAVYVTKGLCIFDHVPGNPADILEWYLVRDQHELVELLAFAAAHAIDAVKEKYDFRKTQRPRRGAGKALDLDMSNHFEATVGRYLITSPAIVSKPH